MLAATEAAALWNLEASTVKKACQAGRFHPHEARKSGGTWLVTLAGMERVYGPRPDSREKEEESPIKKEICANCRYYGDETPGCCGVGNEKPEPCSPEDTCSQFTAR